VCEQYQTNNNYNRLSRTPICFPPPLEKSSACLALAIPFDPALNDVDRLEVRAMCLVLSVRLSVSPSLPPSLPPSLRVCVYVYVRACVRAGVVVVCVCVCVCKYACLCVCACVRSWGRA